MATGTASGQVIGFLRRYGRMALLHRHIAAATGQHQRQNAHQTAVQQGLNSLGYSNNHNSLHNTARV
jgi:hypothetical protein